VQTLILRAVLTNFGSMISIRGSLKHNRQNLTLWPDCISVQDAEKDFRCAEEKAIVL